MSYRHRNLHFKSVFGYSDLPERGRKDPIDCFFDKSASGKKLSTETLMKDHNHVDLQKSEFQHPAKPVSVAFFGMRRSWNEIFWQKVISK